MDDKNSDTDSVNLQNLASTEESAEVGENSDSNISHNIDFGTWDPSACQYEGDKYVYRDPETHAKYVWNEKENDWILEEEDASDKLEGEQKNVVSEAIINSQPSVNTLPENYQFDGESYVYTDKKTNVSYKWNLSKQEWDVQKSTSKRRLPRNEDEEFDTDSEEDETSPEKTQRRDVQRGKIPSATEFPLLENCDYDAETGGYTHRDARDGTLYEWNRDKSAWFPKIDEDFLAHYQMSYGFTADGVAAPTLPSTADADKKQQVVKKEKKLPVPQNPEWFELEDSHNTKVYVSNLPLDVTEEEFVDIMQKCGLIMREPGTNKMKVKLYKDDAGNLKGDALCTYIKIESVGLALNLLDGYDIRNKKLKVERARFEMKGNYDPSKKPRKMRKKEKEKLKRKQEKLFAWRPDKLRGERLRHERVVVVKNLFDPKDFDKEVALILEYQQDLREECGKCGSVKKVVIHDRHPEGIAQIYFQEAEEADACIQLLNGRWFGKRKITAETWDGRTKYRIEETDEERQKRLGTWSQFLEQEEKTSVAKNESENVKDEQSSAVEES